jgi:hypothetical protein
MKRDKELNVDIIGGQGSLTQEEEKMISDFLKSRSTKKSALALKKTLRRTSVEQSRHYR